MIKVAINGFGRIGRSAAKIILDREDIELSAINDLGDPETLLFLLRHDSVYRMFNKSMSVSDGKIKIGGKEIKFFSEKNPADLPWKTLDIDVVIESTGIFLTSKDCQTHLDAGAKKVVISAPANSGSRTTASTPPAAGRTTLWMTSLTWSAPAFAPSNRSPGGFRDSRAPRVRRTRATRSIDGRRACAPGRALAAGGHPAPTRPNRAGPASGIPTICSSPYCAARAIGSWAISRSITQRMAVCRGGPRSRHWNCSPIKRRLQLRTPICSPTCSSG